MKKLLTMQLLLSTALHCQAVSAERKPDLPEDAKLIVWGTVEEVVHKKTAETDNYRIRIRIENKERGVIRKGGRIRSDVEEIWATCFQPKANAPTVPAASGHTAVPRKGQFIRALLLKPRNDEYEGIYPDWFHELKLNDDQRAALKWVQAIGGGSHLACDDSLPRRPVTKMYTFKMWRSGVTDRHMSYAAAFPELRSLDLIYARVRYNGLKTVSGFKKLEHLSLSGYNSGISDHDISPLADCRNLRSLSLMNSAVTDRAMKQLADMPALRHLDLTGTEVTDEGLKDLGRHRNLESLTVSGPKITDRGVQHLTAVKSLKQLSIENTAITDKSLAALKALELTSLRVRACKITEAGMVHLGSQTELTHVGLQGTPATDVVMKALSKCKKLRSVVLQETRVSDEGLMLLAECPDLKRVWIAGTRITPEGLMKFKQALPGCTVGKLPIE